MLCSDVCRWFVYDGSCSVTCRWFQLEMEKALLEGEHRGGIEQLQDDQRNIERLKARQQQLNASGAAHKEQVSSHA